MPIKPDLTTLDGQRMATRRGGYVVLAILAFGLLMAALADYPEDRLTAAAIICLAGGASVFFIASLREMSHRQRWIDAGSIGSPPQHSVSLRRAVNFAPLLGYLFACILAVLSGALYPHWHHVYRHGPWYAITVGALGIVSIVWMLPAIYKANFQKA